MSTQNLDLFLNTVEDVYKNAIGPNGADEQHVTALARKVKEFIEKKSELLQNFPERTRLADSYLQAAQHINLSLRIRRHLEKGGEQEELKALCGLFGPSINIQGDICADDTDLYYRALNALGEIAQLRDEENCSIL